MLNKLSNVAQDRWSQGYDSSLTWRRSRVRISFGPYAMVVQLGERQTEDLDVAGSSPAHGINYFLKYLLSLFELTIFLKYCYLLKKVIFYLNLKKVMD